MNAIRNLETLVCKDTGWQKIDSVIHPRTSAMNVGKRRRQKRRTHKNIYPDTDTPGDALSRYLM